MGGRKMRREGEKEAVLWYDDAEKVSNGCG